MTEDPSWAGAAGLEVFPVTSAEQTQVAGARTLDGGALALIPAASHSLADAAGALARGRASRPVGATGAGYRFGRLLGWRDRLFVLRWFGFRSRNRDRPWGNAGYPHDRTLRLHRTWRGDRRRGLRWRRRGGRARRWRSRCSRNGRRDRGRGHSDSRLRGGRGRRRSRPGRRRGWCCRRRRGLLAIRRVDRCHRVLNDRASSQQHACAESEHGEGAEMRGHRSDPRWEMGQARPCHMRSRLSPDPRQCPLDEARPLLFDSTALAFPLARPTEPTCPRFLPLK